MNTVIQVFKKDLRHLRVPLILWVLVLLLDFAGMAIFRTWNTDSWRSYFIFFTLMRPLLRWLAVVTLVPLAIHEDPVVGTEAFWLTRPISRRSLFGAKAIFACGMILAPSLVALVQLAMSGGSAREMILAVPQVLMQESIFVLLAMLLAALTPSFVRYAMIGVGTFFALMLASALASFFLSKFSRHEQAELSETMTASCIIVLAILFWICAGAVIAHQYLTRRTRISVVMTITALGVLVSAFIFCRWDFLHRQPSVLTAPGFNADDVTVTIEPSKQANDILPAGNAGNQIYQGIVHIEGVPPKWAGLATEIKSSIAVSGSNLPVSSFMRGRFDFKASAEAIQAAMPGMSLLNREAGESTSAQQSTRALFKVSGVDSAMIDGKATYSADVDVSMVKYVVAAEIPLQPGARMDIGSDHDSIVTVKPDPQNLDVSMLLRRAKIALLGFLEPENESAHLRRKSSYGDGSCYMLVNRKRRQALFRTDQYSYLQMTVTFGVLNFDLADLHFPLDRFDRSAITPGEWLADATLVRLDPVPVARFTRHVVIPDFPLHSESD